jgi:two-component system phosphate regulon response regulator PhoB
MQKILVIEDDVDRVDMVSKLLRDAGYTVVSINRHISIHEIYEINPNLAIIDFLLPFGLGDELCFEIKSHAFTKHIPVILYSSSAAFLEKIVGKCKADLFITRPFDLDHFLSEVKRLAT